MKLFRRDVEVAVDVPWDEVVELDGTEKRSGIKLVVESESKRVLLLVSLLYFEVMCDMCYDIK